MTPQEFWRAAQTVLHRWPESTIERNNVGNLTINYNGRQVAYVDLYDGEVVTYSKENPA